MTNSRVSVAMCTYNGSRYVSEQLLSIASQGRVPDELVVCDDGSVDNTVDLLDEFASQAPFQVRILVNDQTLGPAKNFEKAILLCQGEIIALADQDDIWRTQKLEVLIRAFEQNPGAAYVFSDAEMADELGHPQGQKLWDAVSFREKLAYFKGV